MAAFRTGEAVWVELSTFDPEQAEAFYAGLLGWEVRHEQLGSTVYRMCSVGGLDVAGIGAAGLHGDQQHGWITYFAADVESAARRAVELGGELLSGPRYLPAAGHGATVFDPYGALFGLYQAETRVGVESVNAVGALCWNELDTGEPVGSVSYYRSLFGYDVTRRQSSDGRPYTVLSLGDLPVAGVLELDSEWPNLVPAKWITYFNVASLDEAVRRAEELGGRPGLGPVESPHGRLQLVRDPGGHTVCLIELSAGLRPATLPTNPAVTR